MDNVTQTTDPAGGTSPPSAAPDLTGQVLGDFQILRPLGQGGMGTVYLAEQVSLKRKVALKTLRPDLAANPTALQRFEAEAHAVARATHANIVQVYAIDKSKGVHFMALEYVEGRNLREFVTRKGSPEVLLALSIMRQVASALQRASELGIVHRDIKPENILLTKKGEVKVADFGLSRVREGDRPPLNLTQSGVTMGTPLYMSPEQVQGQPIDARTDIYSFGVTCYHMLTGEPPFRGQSPFEVALHHVNTQPVPLGSVRPDLPPELCAIVHKMMAKDPNERYQSGGDLLKDLIRLREVIANAGHGQQTQAVSLGSLSTIRPPVPASPPSAPTPTMIQPRPRGWLLPGLFAGSLFVALGIGMGAALLLRQAQTRPPANLGSAAPDSTALEAPFSLKKEEQRLKGEVGQYANPGKDGEKVRMGLGHNIELGLFYLEQWRLDDAEQLFSHLSASDLPQYRLLGRIGRAIVLALKNNPKESNKEFLELLAERPVAPRGALVGFLALHPKLRPWVATAVEYNAANASISPFPQELEFLRKPSPLGPKPGGDKKP
jgi:tRNA A-37 threonylcarbamoyl transferase component Bud32